MEKAADDAIGWAVGFVRRQKLVLLAVAAVVAALFHAALLGWLKAQAAQLTAAFSAGLSAEQLATGVAAGVVSGLGPPGLTLALALPVVARLGAALGHPCAGPGLGLAVAVNAVLTVPDLVVWQAVFSRAGSRLLPGGRYVRPFVAGTVPWLAAAPLLFLAVHAAALALLGALLK